MFLYPYFYLQTCLRHPESSTARENRDTVFCQMRRAMDLIHFVVKDGVLNSGENHQSAQKDELDMDRSTVYSCMRNLQHHLELSRVTLDSSCHETLPSALEAVLERTQDFTDSAYTTHEHRQAILDGTERLKSELDHLLGLYANVVSCLCLSAKNIANTITDCSFLLLMVVDFISNFYCIIGK